MTTIMRSNTIAGCLLLFTSCVNAQNTFLSDLSPVSPTTGNTWFSADAEFLREGSSIDFSIGFGLEGVIPTEARIVGVDSDFEFDLGMALIAIHSPGPWPDGYDGRTSFYGSFNLPDALREEFLAGETTLQLTGSSVGDFSGAIVPVPEPAAGILIGVGMLLALRHVAKQRLA